jgi:hypothetical protein
MDLFENINQDLAYHTTYGTTFVKSIFDNVGEKINKDLDKCVNDIKLNIDNILSPSSRTEINIFD